MNQEPTAFARQIPPVLTHFVQAIPEAHGARVAFSFLGQLFCLGICQGLKYT